MSDNDGALATRDEMEVKAPELDLADDQGAAGDDENEVDSEEDDFDDDEDDEADDAADDDDEEDQEDDVEEGTN